MTRVRPSWTPPNTDTGFSERVIGFDLQSDANIVVNGLWFYFTSNPNRPTSVMMRLWLTSGPTSEVNIQVNTAGMTQDAWNLVSFASGFAISGGIKYSGTAYFTGAYRYDPTDLTTDQVSADGHVRVLANSGRFINAAGDVFPTDTSAPAFGFGIDLDYTLGGGGGGDTTPPTAPVAQIGLVGATTVGVTWLASTDNVGVTGYDLYQDGVFVTTVAAAPLSYTYAGLTPGTLYHFSLRARDAAGNVSAESNVVVTVTTPLPAFSSATPGADPIIDLVCQYFGGPYSATDHAYVASIIPGVGTWRRGWDKLDDFSLYTRGAPAGSLTGTQIIVAPELGDDRRLTFPAVVGRKHTSHQLALFCYFWSTAPYVEDTQDMVYQVRAAILAALRADPTCGTGGIEAGNFHVGVPDEHGAGGSISWQQLPPVTDDRGATKASMIIRFEAHEIPVG